MSFSSTLAALLAIGVVIAATAWWIVRALLLDEIRGRIKQRAEMSVKETLASVGPELRAEYEEEWLGELDALTSMPFSAMAFARGVRQSASELMGAPAFASASASSRTGSPTGLRQWHITDRLGRFSRRLQSWSLAIRQRFGRIALPAPAVPRIAFRALMLAAIVIGLVQAEPLLGIVAAAAGSAVGLILVWLENRSRP